MSNGIVLPRHRKLLEAQGFKDPAGTTKDGWMSSWQPIETAPKDGGEILAWRKGWKYPHNAAWDANVGEEGSWENPFSSDFMDEPTHWMPLPEPPTGGRMDE